MSRFRHHRGRAVASMIITMSLLTLGTVSPWYLLLTLPPAVWTWWAWRADEHDRMVATTTTGRELLLTGVTSAAVPRLVAATGRPLESG